MIGNKKDKMFFNKKKIVHVRVARLSKDRLSIIPIEKKVLGHRVTNYLKKIALEEMELNDIYLYTVLVLPKQIEIFGVQNLRIGFAR